MPAIQAMRADALAMRSKEDIQEKVPSFYNSVNQALGNSIVKGQDASEALITKRYEAANKILAELRQKLDGQNTLVEQAVGMTMKLISQGIQTVRTFLKQTDLTDLARLATDLLVFNSSIQSAQEQWDAAVATYAQWAIQAGYAGHDNYPNAGGLFGIGGGYDIFPNPGAGYDPNGPVTHSFTQLLVADLGANSDPDPVNIVGDRGSITFTGIDPSDANYPDNLEIYDYDPSLVHIDDDGNDQTAASDDINNTPGSPDFGKPGPDGLTDEPGEPVDMLDVYVTNNETGERTSQPLLYSPDTGLYYIQLTSTVEGNGGEDVDIPALTATTSWQQGGAESAYTATTNHSGAPINRWVRVTHSGTAIPGGTLTIDDTAVSPPPATLEVYDYDPAVSGDQKAIARITNVGIDNGSGGTTTQTVTYVVYEDSANPGQLYIQYQGPDFTGSISAPAATNPDTIGYNGDADHTGTVLETVTLNPIPDPAGMISMGGRGAIMYRDALTPRWTDRRGWGNSELGSGATTYNTYFAYGSVGSITRMGRGLN